MFSYPLYKVFDMSGGHRNLVMICRGWLCSRGLLRSCIFNLEWFSCCIYPVDKALYCLLICDTHNHGGLLFSWPYEAVFWAAMFQLTLMKHLSVQERLKRKKRYCLSSIVVCCPKLSNCADVVPEGVILVGWQIQSLNLGPSSWPHCPSCGCWWSGILGC